MSQEELNRINREIYNAEQGLDKFGKNSPQGQYFQHGGPPPQGGQYPPPTDPKNGS